MILCFVTDRRRYGSDDRTAVERLLEAVGAAAQAGVDLVQIRERDLEDHALLRVVRAAVARVEGTPTRVLVNDRADIALASGAHGVHLRADSAPAARVRGLDASLMLGRSVHGRGEAVAAARGGGCDYLMAGTVFATPSKPDGHDLLGVEGLRLVCGAVSLPVLAVGGMTPERAAELTDAGVAGLAGIRLFADPSTVADTVTRLRRSFDT